MLSRSLICFKFCPVMLLGNSMKFTLICSSFLLLLHYIPLTEQHSPYGFMLLLLGNVTVIESATCSIEFHFQCCLCPGQEEKMPPFFDSSGIHHKLVSRLCSHYPRW